jgi:hypothetical protein
VLAVLADVVDPAAAVANVRKNIATDPEKALGAVFLQMDRNPQCFDGEMKARVGKRISDVTPNVTPADFRGKSTGAPSGLCRVLTGPA